MAVTGNWYFLIVSTFLLTIVGDLVTEKITEKRLGKYTGAYTPTNEPLTEIETKGLKYAGISLLIFSAVLLALIIPQNAPFRSINPDTGQTTLTEFLNSGLILVIFLLFLIPGYAYGKVTGKIKNSTDLVEGMTESMRTMAAYIVLAFFAAQFISYFAYTKLGNIVAVKGAALLNNIGLKGIPLILLFILLTSFINLFMGSASAKWAIMAPVFVPMLFHVGISPEMTQMAYRIAD